MSRCHHLKYKTAPGGRHDRAGCKFSHQIERAHLVKSIICSYFYDSTAETTLGHHGKAK